MPSSIKRYFDELSEERSTIEIPEWGKTVYVGPLTMAQYRLIADAKKVSDSECALTIIRACAKDEKGRPAFDSEEQEDLRLYGTPAVILRVADQIESAIPSESVTDQKKH